MTTPYQLSGKDPSGAIYPYVTLVVPAGTADIFFPVVMAHPFRICRLTALVSTGNVTINLYSDEAAVTDTANEEFYRIIPPVTTVNSKAWLLYDGVLPLFLKTKASERTSSPDTKLFVRLTFGAPTGAELTVKLTLNGLIH